MVWSVAVEAGDRAESEVPGGGGAQRAHMWVDGADGEGGMQDADMARGGGGASGW